MIARTLVSVADAVRTIWGFAKAVPFRNLADLSQQMRFARHAIWIPGIGHRNICQREMNSRAPTLGTGAFGTCLSPVMMRLAVFTVFAGLFVCSAIGHASQLFFAERVGELARRTEEASRAMKRVELARFVENEFKRLDLPTDARKIGELSLSADEFRALFRALSLRVFYSPTASNVLDFERSAQILDHQFGLRGGEVREVYATLIRGRFFDRALPWQAKMNPLAREQLPEIIDRSGSSTGVPVWSPHPTRAVLTRTRVPIRTGPSVVVSVSLGCGYSRSALQAILTLPELRRRLSGIALWLVPPEGMLRFPEYQRWNAANPGLELVLAHQMEDWPFIDTLRTPSFYFLKDGKVVREIVGWPDRGMAKEIIMALDEIGSH